jgi:glyoxylate utilization-related uncharacterized protein
VDVLRKSFLFAWIAVLACAGIVSADPVPYEISGELRVRNENDNRDFNAETGYKSFNLMRTRLGINVHPVTDMTVFVQVQDARVQGLEGPSTIPGVQEDNTLDLHQGFFQVDNLGWQGFGVRAGRMEVRYGNERLLGVTDWSNTPTAFDAVSLGVNQARFNVSAMFANLVERDTPVIGTPETENSDATLQSGVASIALTQDATANADLQVINVRDKVTPSEDDDRSILTLGGRVHGNAATRFDYSVEAAYQTGSQETGPTTKVDLGAYMFAGQVGVTVGQEARPVRIAAGYDYLSGDENTVDDKSETFNTLFGDNHTFYGLMDMPQVVSTSGPNTYGLQDIHLQAKATVWSNVNNVIALGGEFHNFAMAAKPSGVDGGLGNEVDLSASWQYRERFAPTLGFSAFLPGDAIPGPTPTTDADNSYWLYLQGVVSF